MVWSSQLWDPSTGLDPEWISYPALMVQVRAFQGFWHALVMYDNFCCILPLSLSLSLLFCCKHVLPVTESPASWATQACWRWPIPENFCLYKGCNWSCFADDCKCNILYFKIYVWHAKEVAEWCNPFFFQENPARANGHIFNVGNPNNEVTVRQLAEMMIQVKGCFLCIYTNCGLMKIAR